MLGYDRSQVHFSKMIRFKKNSWRRSKTKLAPGSPIRGEAKNSTLSAMPGEGKEKFKAVNSDRVHNSSATTQTLKCRPRLDTCYAQVGLDLELLNGVAAQIDLGREREGERTGRMRGREDN